MGRTISWIFFLLFIYHRQVIAESQNIEIIVIEDRGGESIYQYLPDNYKANKQVKNAMNKHQIQKSYFPVRTPSLKVGKVTENEAEGIKFNTLSMSVFIIGYDPVSINWLIKNKKYLENKKAIGLVVNVETNEDMEKLNKIVGNSILMQPTPGEKLSEKLKIKHYPFYIDSNGVMR